MSWREIGGYVVIGILIALLVLVNVQSCNRQKSVQRLTVLYESCITAPITTDTVHDTVFVYDTTWIRLKSKPIVVHDTTVKWCEMSFDSTYKFSSDKGYGRIHYAIEVKDCNTKIQFKEIVAPKEIVTITKHIDTCVAKLPAYYPKNHWWLYGRPTVALTPIKITGITAGALYTFKDRWGVGLGVGYDWNINRPTTEVMVLFNLK